MKKLVLVCLFLCACGGSVETPEVTSVSVVETCDAGVKAPDAGVSDPCAHACDDGGTGAIQLDGQTVLCACPKFR